MKRIVIIEDEKPAADRLKRLISKIAEVQVLAHIESVEEAVDWFTKNEAPDIAFFDIQLADGKSFQIFDQAEIDCPIIFVTAFDEYAIHAFKVNSVDYLLKPIEENELKSAWQKFLNLYGTRGSENYKSLNKELRQLLEKKQYKTRFLIKSGEQFKFILSEESSYFFSDEGNTFLVDSEGKQFLIDEKLDGLEQKLDPNEFHRINRKFIVNQKTISKISSYFNNRLILELTPLFKGEVIVSRERVSDFKKWLGN